jgi:hypothetical protein
MENTNVSEIIAKIESNCEFGGNLYSKEQVVNILRMVKCTYEPSNSVVDVDWLESLTDLIDDAKNELECVDIDYASIEVEVSGREIELSEGEIENLDDLEESLDKLRTKVEEMVVKLKYIEVKEEE